MSNKLFAIEKAFAGSEIARYALHMEQNYAPSVYCLSTTTMYENDTMSSESLILRAESSYPSMNVTEITMAQKSGKAPSGQKTTFPPEADGEFEIVSEAKIADWREKLNERFSIGKGKLKVISEPSRAS